MNRCCCVFSRELWRALVAGSIDRGPLECNCSFSCVCVPCGGQWRPMCQNAGKCDDMSIRVPGTLPYCTVTVLTGSMIVKDDVANENRSL